MYTENHLQFNFPFKILCHNDANVNVVGGIDSINCYILETLLLNVLSYMTIGTIPEA